MQSQSSSSKQDKSAIRRFPWDADYDRMMDIAKQYEKAITRRKRQATDPEYLAEIWRSNSGYFLRHKNNFLMLRKIGPNSYAATHLAPATLRGGRDLMHKALNEKANIVFTVPEDLQQNLQRIGFKPVPRVANQILQRLGMPDSKGLMIQNNMKGVSLLADAGFGKLKDAIATHRFMDEPPVFHGGNNPRFQAKPAKSMDTSFARPISKIVPPQTAMALKQYSARTSQAPEGLSRTPRSIGNRRIGMLAGPIASGLGYLLRNMMMENQQDRINIDPMYSSGRQLTPTSSPILRTLPSY